MGRLLFLFMDERLFVRIVNLIQEPKSMFFIVISDASYGTSRKSCKLCAMDSIFPCDLYQLMCRNTVLH